MSDLNSSRFKIAAVFFLLFSSLLCSGGCGPHAGKVSVGDSTETIEIEEGQFPEPRLSAASPHTMRMNLREGKRHEFAFAVPEDAIAAVVEVEGSPCSLDIFAGFDETPADVSSAAHINAADENRLTIARLGEPPLETGEYRLVIEYPFDTPPVFSGAPVHSFECTIALNFIKPSIVAELKESGRVHGRVGPAIAGMTTYAIDVPADAKALRVDLDQTESDLNLWARFQKPIVSIGDAEVAMSSFSGRETLLLDASTDPPLRPGRWLVSVVEPYLENDAGFELHVSFDGAAPKELLEIPNLPVGETPLERAVHATVELSTGNVLGTGVLLNPDGLILTNHHVISDAIVVDERHKANDTRPGSLDLICVAVTLDPRHPPVDLFRAKLIDWRKGVDLAIVQITTGFHGQPLPKDYRFPFVELGEPKSLTFGDRLSIVGFPSAGGFKSRPSVTVSQGIVSGFSGPYGIKTDAPIMGGNSGGAALNADGKLVGVPTLVVDEGYGGLGYVGYLFSVQAMPDDWRRRMEGL